MKTATFLLEHDLRIFRPRPMLFSESKLARLRDELPDDLSLLCVTEPVAVRLRWVTEEETHVRERRHRVTGSP
jgi:hypothetical protein